MVTYADEILDVFIQTIKEIKPNLVILTGDLSFNGEKGSHEALAKNYLYLKMIILMLQLYLEIMM